MDAHRARRRAVRALRMAGYVARRRWARQGRGWRQHGLHHVPSWVYLDGPAAGAEAIDPWDRAKQLADCSGSWGVQPRVTSAGDLLALPIPSACGQVHVCPVCAARRSRSLAREIRAAIRGRDPGAMALVTLTQRAIPGESLVAALERWRRAWELLTRGRQGRRLRRWIRGWYYGIEVRWNPAGWWHLHGHVVVELRANERVPDECETCGAAPGAACRSLRGGRPMRGFHAGRSEVELGDPVDVAAARAELGRGWRDASESAAPEWGWDPLAGCWDRDSEPASAAEGRIAAGDWTGAWWREIDPGDTSAVYQACKYPTPITDLGAVQLAEFVSATHGRRWHQGGWDWRSIRADGADQIAADLADDDDAIDLGIPIASLAPGHVPDLDEIFNGRGRAASVEKGRRTALASGETGEPIEGGTVEWVLVQDAEVLARQWEGEGWCSLGWQTIKYREPAPPEHPDAVSVLRRHPDGTEDAISVVVRERVHPVLTVASELAAVLVARTEDLILTRARERSSGDGRDQRAHADSCV